MKNHCIYCGEEVKLETYNYCYYHLAKKVECIGYRIKNHTCEKIEEKENTNEK